MSDEDHAPKRPGWRRRLLLGALGAALGAVLVMVLVVRHRYHDLPQAARRGSKVGVWAFLLTGADVNGGHRDPPLYQAAQGGHAEVGDLLIRWGADVDRAPTNNWPRTTPLHVAVRNGDARLVRLLLGAGADPNLERGTRGAPLHMAVEGGSIEICRLLIENGADPSRRTHNGPSPLYCAAKHQADPSKILTLLIESGAELNRVEFGYWTVLTWAAAVANMDILRLALEHNADPLVKDKHGYTALAAAIKAYRPEVARYLVEKSAWEPDILVLAMAVTPEYRWSLPILLHGCSAEALKGEPWSSALLWAAKDGYAEAVKLLLEKGADPNSRNDKGQTPLHLAAQLNRVGTVATLLAHGADPSAADKKGRTPLSLCGRGPVARLLIASGAK